MSIYRPHARLSLKTLTYISWILFTCFANQIAAQQFPDSSCENLEGINAEGQQTNYGDVRPKITAAVVEARLIASTALEVLKRAFEFDFENYPFDVVRASESYTVFQGPTEGDSETYTRRDTVLKSLETLSGNTEAPQVIPILCGDGHLTKSTNYEDDSPILDDKGAQSFQYYDGYAKKDFPVGEKACNDNTGDIAITRDTYIQICAAAFSYAQRVMPESTIGSRNMVDWSSTEYNGRGEQSLEYWATPLSYTMFHEMTHLLLEYDDYYLQTEVPLMGGTTNKAYRYNGAVQLVAENLDSVSNNVDNLGMLALSLFMEKNNWSQGRARPNPFAD